MQHLQGGLKGLLGSEEASTETTTMRKYDQNSISEVQNSHVFLFGLAKPFQTPTN